MTEVAAHSLARPVQELAGVGPERTRLLANLGVTTVADLLGLSPRRHEDRRQMHRLEAVPTGEPVMIRGRIAAQGTRYNRRSSQSVFEIIVEDGSGRLHCRWWNQPYRAQQFHVGDELLVFGRCRSVKPPTMDQPETEILESGEDQTIHFQRIVPIYPLTEGLSQRWLRGLIWRALAEIGAQVPEPWPGLVNLLNELSGETWPTRAQALQNLHFPSEMPAVETARQRLALEEFLALQLQIQTRRHNLQTKARGRPCGGDNHLIKPFLGRLGFALTSAQTRVLREIRRDMGTGIPMRRLLQGDVGAGKTAVAACALLMALESGADAALMVPTEILATQHHQTFSRWFAPLNLRVELRTGSQQIKPDEAGGRSGAGTLFIGTHALIQAEFQAPNLGLVVVDEQHKFGVTQRETLVRKGYYPHLLVMTATPIPRTLGLTLYGDLDVSVLDELPTGRGDLRTFVRPTTALPKVWNFIRGQLQAGRQAYVVYPRVEESDLTTGIKAVTTEWEQVRQALAPYTVGLLHGRLRPEAKAEVMAAFKSGQVPVLLATSIVEVGLDVPNATVMLVENAEQFGLAQLHQLRGRIGRGSHASYCILVASQKTAEARERLRVLEETNDGFRVAEADLALRGPGELLGREQSGLPPFKYGNLSQDEALITLARRAAQRLQTAAS